MAFSLAVIVFVYGLFFLKDWRVTGGTYLIEAAFSDINGLNRSDPVLLGGVRIGKVEEVRLENQVPVAILRIEDAYPVPRDSWVEVIDRSVMGEKALTIHKGVSADTARPGERLAGRTSPGLFAVVTKADTLSATLQALLNNANALLDPNASKSIKTSLNNVHDVTETLLATLNQERQRIHRTMANMDTLVNTMQELSSSEKTKLSATLSNLERTSVELNTLIDRLQGTTTSLETILTRIEQGQGTIGKLINDDKLYTDMDRMLINLDGLITDLKTNPKRYLSIEIF
jgi:phospholipid/cholesterol/gamma-HCH transport system substrate-binding protein